MVERVNGIPNLINENTVSEAELKKLRSKSLGERHEFMQNLARKRMEIKKRRAK